MSCTINEFTKVYIRDFCVQDSRESEKLREILRHYDGQVKINLYTDNRDNGKRLKSYNTQGGVGVYVSNNTIYFRFTSVFKFTDNLKYSLSVTSVFYDKTEPLIIDLFTENDLFDYLNILYDSRYMKIKRNPCANIMYNKANDAIGYKYIYEIDNNNIYKSKKLYKYHIPLSKDQYSIINASHISLLSCNFFDDSNIRININLENIFITRGHNLLANYIHLYITKDNTEAYLVLYSNKKVKHPEEIKITNVSRTKHIVSINIEDVDMFDEFFFWDKTFKDQIRSIDTYTVHKSSINENKEESKDIDNENKHKIITWDQYFMEVAELSALRSKDPSRQVGACIVKDNVIVGTGYNGFPRGCSDKEFPWTKDSKEITETKYAYVVHAELNAILNSTRDLDGATIYVTLFPCTECTKAIIQSGIKKVVYKSIPEKQKEIEASKKMFKAAGVEVESYE